jgi:glycosyltransferase involved in cell wall biosynthesis
LNPELVSTIIVIPCFNEEKRWGETYWELFTELPNLQILFVDDGSTDDTSGCISKTLNNFRSSGSQLGEILILEANKGKANAIRLGLLEVLRNYPAVERIGFLDSDGAFDPYDISRIVSMEWSLDINSIWTSRVKLSGRSILRKNSRHWISRVIATGLGIIDSSLPYDTQCGFKLFQNTSSLREALQAPFRTKWFFDLELYSRCPSLIIWEEPLNDWVDVNGSKLSLRSTISVFRELMIVIKLLRKKILLEQSLRTLS